jgi:hypothetical protein
MMEMKYLKVSTSPDAEAGLPSSAYSLDVPDDASPGRSSPVWIIRRFIGFLNSYLQITSPGYQHGAPERKISFIVFLTMFICFVFSLFFLFTAGDVCSSHQQGLDRLRAERDHLAAELAALRAPLVDQPNIVDNAIIPPPVIP